MFLAVTKSFKTHITTETKYLLYICITALLIHHLYCKPCYGALSCIFWASEYFIKTEALNYLPDIRQLHSSTIPHLGSWYWAACSSQLFLHSSSQKTLSDICWDEVSVIRINSPRALSTNKPVFFFFYKIHGAIILSSTWLVCDRVPGWDSVWNLFGLDCQILFISPTVLSNMANAHFT